MNTAIIVAAGSSQRFAASQPKQFVPVLGKPLIFHTLERFAACDSVDEIVLVLSEQGSREFALHTAGRDIAKLSSIAPGGMTRAASVKNGLDAIDPATANIIAVHDGARPLVTVDEITRTIDRAIVTGASCLVADVTDTIKQVDEAHIIRTIDRWDLRRALTPQAFRYDVINRAFHGADLDDSITDECLLVERLGVKIAFVEGSSRNIKVTRPEDIILAEAILKDHEV